MRSPYGAVCTALSVLTWLSLGVSAPTQARPHKPARLVVAVLPFGSHDGISKAVARRLRHSVSLSSKTRAISNALDDAGESGFQPVQLAAILGHRHVDVLVRLQSDPAGIVLTAFGKDGLPRLKKELPLESDREIVRAVAGALGPVLEGWRDLKPLPQHRGDAAGGGGGGDDDAPPHALTSAGDGGDEHKVPLHSIDDESEGSSASPAGDDDSSSAVDSDESHESIDDVEAAAKPEGGGHHRSVAVSAGLDIGTWSWSFDGAPDVKASAGAPIFSGGSVLLDVSPLAFAGIRFIAVDAELAGAFVPFTLRGTPVAPQEFSSPQVRASALLKLRYTFSGGTAIGVRGGYRTIIAAAAKQQTNVAGAVKNVTVIPAYRVQAIAAGVDAFIPIDVGGHPLELEARLEALPLTSYVEAPDNPGAASVAFGGYAFLAARYVDASGLFIEGRVEGTGVRVTFTDVGTRNALKGDALVPIEGGTTLNLGGAASLGAGFEF